MIATRQTASLDPRSNYDLYQTLAVVVLVTVTVPKETDKNFAHCCIKQEGCVKLKVHGHGQTHSRNFCRFKLDI